MLMELEEELEKEPEEKTFKYDDLSDEAKAKAVERYREKGWDWDQDDSTCQTEYFKEILEEKGYSDVELSWSLGYCQGDGVSFYGGSIDVVVIAKRIMSKMAFRRLDELCVEPDYNGRNTSRFSDYLSCSLSGSGAGRNNYSSFDYDIESEVEDYYPEAFEKLKEIAGLIEDDVKDLESELEKIGYAEIEYRNSDEQIIESITSNEYDFDEDGDFA